jgi:drug/metabolite transporter (DMT)-like permease
LHRRSPFSIGLLCLAVTSVGWGINWPAMKVLLDDWPPLFARGLSGLCAALIVAALARAARQGLRVPRDAWGGLVASSFFNVLAWMGLATLSMRWLSAGQAALLVYTMPVWATLLAWPLSGRRPGGRTSSGLLLCIVGVGLLFVGSSGRIEAAQWPGVLFALGSAVLFAIGTIVLKPLPLPALSSVAWQLAIGCLPMLLFGLAVERPLMSALTPRGAAVMVYMTLVPMGLCYITWFAALRRIPRTLASIATLLTPAIGVTAAAAALGEPFGTKQVLALCLTLSGVALALAEAGR